MRRRNRRSRRCWSGCCGRRTRAAPGTASRAGARTAAVQADDVAIRAAALAAAPDLDPSVSTVSVMRAGTQGDPVTVSIAYDEAIRVPLIDWLFDSTVRLTAQATDRQEFA